MPILIAAFALVLAFVTPTPPASVAPENRSPVVSASAENDTGIGIRLVDIPAAASGDPRAHSYIVDNVAPGTTIKRRVEVQNNTGTALTVKMYAGSAHITGGAFVGDDAGTVNELTTWTSLDQPELNLSPHEKTAVLATIVVPADAAEGEQYAALWAEARSVPDPASNVISASRVGIRIYLSVSPGNGPVADFALKSVAASRTPDGHPQVTATVTNTGGRALDLSGELSLAEGPSGLSAGPFSTSTATTLAPGMTEKVVVPLGADLPNGPWRATLTLSSGLLTRDAVAKLTFPAVGTSVAAEIEPEWPVLPWIIAGAVAVLTIGTGSAVWLTRRRKRSLN